MRDKKMFINPYQFIPLGEKKQSAYSAEGETTFTGRLAYRVATQTPLFIPNTSNSAVFCKVEGEPDDPTKPDERHISYDFFSYTDLTDMSRLDEKGNKQYFPPVIPGSEVRGMVRSVYETLTDSCLLGIQKDDEILSKRTMEYGKPGLLLYEGSRLFLCEANDYIYYEGSSKTGELTPFYQTCSLSEGDKVEFRRVKSESGRAKAEEVKSWSDQSTGTPGYLIKGEKGIEIEDDGGKKRPKHNCHIFTAKIKSKESVSPAVTKRFLNVLESYGKENEEAYQEYAANLNEFFKNKKECFPVYFSKVGNELYLAPACVSREASRYTIPDLIKTFKPCKGKKGDRCPACDLFGMIGEKNQDSKSSQLRFTDLLPEQEKDCKDYYTEAVTIPELAQPKFSNTEFYLKTPEGAAFTTFDYYIKDNKIIQKPAEIAGRKFYWHNLIADVPCAVKKEGEASNRTIRNRTIRAVKPNNSFVGYVYFDHITEKQLRQLVWILNLSAFERLDDNKAKYGYKLGMGKPLGMGSVTMELIPEACHLRTWEQTAERITLSQSQKPLDGKYEISYEEAGFSEKSKKMFLFLMQLHATDGWTVSYPYCNPDEMEDNGYEWYTQNHLTAQGKPVRGRQNMVSHQHLKGFEEVDGDDYEMKQFQLFTKTPKDS